MSYQPSPDTKLEIIATKDCVPTPGYNVMGLGNHSGLWLKFHTSPSEIHTSGLGWRSGWTSSALAEAHGWVTAPTHWFHMPAVEEVEADPEWAVKMRTYLSEIFSTGGGLNSSLRRALESCVNRTVREMRGDL